MKMHKLFNRLFIPIITVLLLLPPISCLIFYGVTKQFTYNEATEDLEMLQNRILPLMAESFPASKESKLNDYTKNDYSEQVNTFLKQIGPILSKTSGNSKLMILESKLQIVYPRDKEEKKILQPLGNEFAKYIEENSITNKSNTIKFSSENGENYLVNIFKVPTKSLRIQYIIAYCPTSQIGAWIQKATIWVLGISTVFVCFISVILWLTVRSITEPLKVLCHETERIGSGEYINIHPSFSIVELEELRYSMNQMSSKLKQAEDTQKNFLQNVSHELRNPLMSITGYAQGIEQGIFSSVKDASHTILDESIRLTELVNSLLTLSRVENPSVSDKFGKVWIADCIEDSLDRLNGLALQKNIIFSLESFDHNITAYGNDELITNIIDNLISNAIRYAEKQIKIIISEKSQNTISISVIDDGPGISEKDLPHIFERCYKGKGGNFGIGLAIAKASALKIGGELNAKNNTEMGAVFTLILKKYTK